MPDAAAQQAALQPPPPPTFNVRALMQSLAQAKQQQQQPTASRPASATASGPPATVAAATTAAMDQGGAASQVELELRLGTLIDPMDLQLGGAVGDAAAEAATGEAAAAAGGGTEAVAPSSPVRAGSEENEGDLVIEDDQPKVGVAWRPRKLPEEVRIHGMFAQGNDGCRRQWHPWVSVNYGRTTS